MKRPLILIVGKLTLISFLSLSSMVSISNLSSCGSTIRIQAPSNNNFVGYIDAIHSGYVTIGKFSYTGLLDHIDDISISHTFKQGFASFEPSISDIDVKNKTFYVILKVSNGYEGNISGSLQFSSNERNIEFESKNFSIELRRRVSIQVPSVSLDTNVILDTKSEYLATNTATFTSSGIDDFTKLHVSSTFTDEVVEFKTTVTYVDDNKFNVKIELLNATKAQDFFGHLIFEYSYGDDNVKILETNNFKLSILPERSIIEPKYEKQDIIFKDKKTSFTIDGFQFNDIDQPKYLIPSIHFLSSSFPGSYTVSIINWNTYFKTFSIQIDITDATFINQPIEFNISFKYQESIACSLETYCTQPYFPIPEDNLEIEINEESRLVELVGISEPILHDYNAFLVPDEVESIALCEQAQTLLSQKKDVHLMLPRYRNLINISDNCFQNCLGLIGTLSFPSTLLSVGTSPFESTSFTTLDFTDYDEIPTWFHHTLTLNGLKETHGTVLVSADIPIDVWSQNLETEGLDTNNWNIVQV